MPYKSPDKKAPRFRKKKCTVLGQMFYYWFKKKYPKYKDIRNEHLTKIISAYSDEIRNHIVSNRDGIELPENLGILFLGTCDRPKKLNIDVKKSIEYGQIVTYKNHETDGYLGKLFHSFGNNKHNFPLREIWSFKAVRSFKHQVSDAYKKNWKIFFKIGDYKRISYIFSDVIRKDKAISRMNTALETYNEFAF